MRNCWRQVTSAPLAPSERFLVMVQRDEAGGVAIPASFAAMSCVSSAVRVFISASRVAMRDWVVPGDEVETV